MLDLEVLLHTGIAQVGIFAPVGTSWLCAYDLHRMSEVDGRSIFFSALM
jgi:hypothetical protein